MTDFRQTITSPVVCEKTTCQLTQQLTDESDVNITSAQVSALTLTLYDKKTGAVLNSRSAQSILNTNGGTLSSGGLLTLVLAIADNALNAQAAASEQHVALIEYTWASGLKAGKKEITFTVVNQAKVS
jgi:hypothetical protein